jgi:hypothetical protein
MKKLSLDLAELKVESFETFVSERDANGTVRANGSCVTWSDPSTCGAQPDSNVMKNGPYAATFINCTPVDCTNNGPCCV